MKIAILSNLFPPNSYGGAEQAAKAQAEKLSREGNDVFIITLAPTKGLGGINKIYYLKSRNIFNYYNIGKKPVWFRFLWHIIDTFNFCLANDIVKILKREKPDLVICHNLKGLSFLTPFKIQNSKFKIHFVVHDVSLYTPSGLIEWGKENSWEHTGILTRAYRFFTRRLMGYPEKAFFPSAWLLNFYRKNGFFINQEKIYKPNDVGFVCDNKSINNQQLTINNFLFVGKLERHKGILLLLNVFEKLTAGLSSRAKPADSAGKSRDLITSKKLADEISPQGRNDKIVLHIIGDGSLMPEVKKYAEKNLNIKIHGTLPRGELQKFYAQAKAVIVPSIVYENAPNVVYEALSCGAPVIVSRIGGAYEPIRDGENGDTFNPGDAEDLAEKIKKYI